MCLDPLGLERCTKREEWIYLHSSTCWWPVELIPFVENAVFFLLDGFSYTVKDQVTIGVGFHFWVFNSIPLIHLPVSVTIPYSFYPYCSIIQLEIKDSDSPRRFFILENSFAILIFLLFQMNLQLYEDLRWNFDGDCIGSVDCFHQNGHFSLC